MARRESEPIVFGGGREEQLASRTEAEHLGRGALCLKKKKERRPSAEGRIYVSCDEREIGKSWARERCGLRSTQLPLGIATFGVLL